MALHPVVVLGVCFAAAGCVLPGSSRVDGNELGPTSAPPDAGPPGGADAGARDAGLPTWTVAGHLALSWDGGVARAEVAGRVTGSLLDPPSGCYRTGFDVPFQFELDRQAVLDAVVAPYLFLPFVGVQRDSSGPFLGCGAAGAFQGAALAPGTYVVFVASHAIGSGPDAGAFELRLSFVAPPDGG